MGYFDADAEDMLEVYLLETRQLTGQLSAVLLDTEKRMHFPGRIFTVFSGLCIQLKALPL